MRGLQPLREFISALRMVGQDAAGQCDQSFLHAVMESAPVGGHEWLLPIPRGFRLIGALGVAGTRSPSLISVFQ